MAQKPKELTFMLLSIEENKEGRAKKGLKEVMAKKFPNVAKDINYRFKRLNELQIG